MSKSRVAKATISDAELLEALGAAEDEHGAGVAVGVVAKCRHGLSLTSIFHSLLQPGAKSSLPERVPSAHRDRIIRECFESGVCRGTTRTKSADRPGVAFQTFEFEARILIGNPSRVFSLIVGVVRDAFRGAAKHRALTIYKPEDPNV